MAINKQGAILLIFIFLGCETPPTTAPYLPPSRPDVLKKARELLIHDQVMEAAVILKNLEPLGAQELGIRTEVQQAFLKLWAEFKSQDDYGALTNLDQDMKTLGYSPGDNFDVDEGLLNQYIKKNWGAASVLQMRKILPKLQGKERLDRARILRDEEQFLAFGQAVEGLEPLLSPEDKKFLSAAPSNQDFIRGTVTVLVNKGLKIEAGLGSPDVVIGSGFFIDKRGYLLTNYHVIQSEVDPEYEGYSRLFISLPNSKGDRIPAKVLGWDANLDVALVKAEVEAPWVFSFAPQPNLKQGDRLYAIGSPGGLEATITAGIVSAVGRKFLPMGEALQMDVAVNPGNSGGPLVDENGWVVGLVFAGVPEFQGVNFAISGVYIQRLIPWLYQGGPVSHLWLGLGAHDTWKGMELDYVAKGGPGDREGIKPGMVLTSIQDRNLLVDSEIHLPLLDRRQVVKTTWVQEGISTDLYILRKLRPELPLAKAFETQPPEDLIPHLFGMGLEIQGNPSSRWFRVTSVVPGTSADQLGLAPGDPIQLKDWRLLEEEKAILAQFFVKRRLGGYFESTIELGAYLQSARVF